MKAAPGRSQDAGDHVVTETRGMMASAVRSGDSRIGQLAAPQNRDVKLKLEKQIQVERRHRERRQ